MKTTITVIKSKKTVLNNKKGDKTKSQHFRFPIHHRIGRTELKKNYKICYEES